MQGRQQRIPRRQCRSRSKSAFDDSRVDWLTSSFLAAVTVTGNPSPTFRFSGGADAQLSPITLQGLAVRGCARLALAAHVAVTVAVSDHWAGCRPCTPIMLPVHCATVPELDR